MYTRSHLHVPVIPRMPLERNPCKTEEYLTNRGFLLYGRAIEWLREPLRLLCLAALSAFACVAQNATPKFVYVAADYLVTSSNGCLPNSYIVGYTVDANTGSLTPIPGSPFSAPGFAPVHITADPLGRFVWVVNQKFDCSGSQVNGTIATFRVDAATGALTSSGPLVSSEGFDPFWLSTDPTGKFAYVANGCISFSFCTGLIAVFSINQSDGTLTPTAGCPLAPRGALGSSIVLDPAGKFAYVAGQNSVSAFSVDALTGGLTPAGSPFPGQSPGPFGAGLDQDDIFVDQSGKLPIALDLCFNCQSTIENWAIESRAARHDYSDTGPGERFWPTGQRNYQSQRQWPAKGL